MHDQQAQRIIVIGGSPGSGKSTTGMELCRALNAKGDEGRWVHVDKDPTTRVLQLLGQELAEQARTKQLPVSIANTTQLIWAVAAQIYCDQNVILSAPMENLLCDDSPWIREFVATLGGVSDVLNRSIHVAYVGLTVGDKVRYARLVGRKALEQDKIGSTESWELYCDKVHAYDAAWGLMVQRVDVTGMDVPQAVRAVWQTAQKGMNYLPKGHKDDIPEILHKHVIVPRLEQPVNLSL